ncbi:bifunctional glycosyltransferase/CDP-glycerol:glycerophosphate glycerophosphotransferase [Streptomyces indicus]|uniref:CDP-glycerol glycerophosphotransferase n=1 Tax=Streptomyces indicus TaxID=417292 RepID=A0A1G9E0N1_9ACTN|nr:CDP-glycerol glycerophosphotransferase family protein [Streptomyces indicus]SDK69664.1 CDP-glycerol glycerophosphotransferase [Streptomyces indicus]
MHSSSASPRPTDRPRLTVVVPIYNVEDYLEECLRSIAGQTLRSLDVILVDDGSTDDSPRIARAFAARDGRFRYVRQDNAGLSAARNTGVRASDPQVEFLTFVDSDDIVPHDAYERMTASLDASGSDFATGNVWRLNERGRQQAWQYKWLTKDRTRTHITRDPELLADRVAWNKVFRRAFWDAHAFTFPEGRLYEDTPVMIPAHFLAGAVDVLTEHVYYWRVREGSITRRRTEVKGVRDRIAACDSVSRFLAERFPQHKRTYDLSCLRDDFVYFLEGLPMGGPEYRAAFLADTAAFLGRADASLTDGLPVDLRIKWQLVREGRTAELIELLAYEQRNKTVFEVRGGLRKRAVYPGVEGVPRRASRLGRRELPVVARVSEARFGADGKLRISGYAYVRNVEATRPGHSVKAGLLKSAQSRVQLRRVPTRTVPGPAATVDSGQELHCYDYAGFEMTVDPEQLKTGGRWRPGNWLLGVVVAGHGMVRRAAVRALDGAAAQSVVRELGDGLRLVLGYSQGRLVLRVQEYAARVESHERDGEDLLLHGRLHHGTRPEQLRLAHKEHTYDYPLERTGDRFTVRVPLADLEQVPPTPHRAPKEVEPQHGDRWSANLVLPGGALKSLAASASLPPGRYATGRARYAVGREVCATANDNGQLVVELTRQPVADVARWRDEGVLVIEGTAAQDSWGPAELVLRHSADLTEVTVPLERSAGRFRATLVPATAHGGRPLPEGRWYLFLRERNEAGDGVPVRVLASLGTDLPAVRECDGREFTVDRRFGDRLLIASGSALAPGDRGAYRRHRLRTAHYPAQRALPLRDAILYTDGKGLDGGSPRAIHEELLARGAELEHLWVTCDQQTQVPPAARGVAEGSREWYEALARSRVIVTSGHLPDWFERREGQRVVQTWHGTPLKRVGLDLTDTLYADHSHLDALPRLSAQWSVLVSPSRHATSVLPRALAYEGEVLEAGSPRNDVLFAADRAKVADRVRAELGLSPEDERRIVLYAPTYRDHLIHSGGRFRHEETLDLPQLERALGDDHLLLVRRHPRAAGRLPGASATFVRDVTTYPDATELLLSADVLITDYSSLMFDFAHTGRPLLFHTYDLEHYRDTVRGFTLDFEAAAPGPLLTSTGEIVEALRDLDGTAARHADAYAAFRQAYGDLDDGKAAARVADWILG